MHILSLRFIGRDVGSLGMKMLTYGIPILVQKLYMSHVADDHVILEEGKALIQYILQKIYEVYTKWRLTFIPSPAMKEQLMNNEDLQNFKKRNHKY